MADGPWTKYQAAPAGPWTKYQSSAGGQGAQGAVPEPKVDPATKGERFSSGLADPFVGAAQLEAHILPQPVIDAINWVRHHITHAKGDVSPESVDQVVKSREADIEARDKAAGVNGTDWYRVGGNVTATLPLAALSPVTGGAVSGALTPVTKGDFATEKAEQTALGAAGGKIAQVGGNALARVIAPAVKKAGQVISPIVQQARDAGYVLPPSMISDKAKPVVNALAGWGGKIKMQQAASVKNQETTNRLAAKALGLPEDTTLTERTLNDVRSNASKAYQDLASAVPSIKIDDVFRQDVNHAAGRTSQAAQHFPELMDNPQIRKLRDSLVAIQRDAKGRVLPAKNAPPGAWVDLVRQLRFKATQNLKAIGDPEKHALGLAQRQVADAVDHLIERNLAKTGHADLVDAYRAARQLIAKAHDVESVTNTSTGDVSARGLAKLADKGRPLSGELRVIADTAAAFPKATQEGARFGGDEPHSAVDFFGSALALGHGNPSVAGAILARPVVRNFLLSKMMQNRLAPQMAKVLPAIQPSASLAARNYLADLIRKGAPYAAPAGAVLAQQAAGP